MTPTPAENFPLAFTLNGEPCVKSEGLSYASAALLTRLRWERLWSNKPNMDSLTFRSSVLFCLAIIESISIISWAQDRPAYLPNSRLTPGDAFNVTKDDLCGPNRVDRIHGIPVSLKRQIFDRYGIGPNSPGLYDVEHLIPPNLGGSNSIKNLWPQPVSGEWSHALKDKLEHRLHKMVCSGELDLKTAQQEIASDWVRAYKRYIGEQGKPRR